MILNFSALAFEDVEISVGWFPYSKDGGNQLRTLREKHQTSHVFRRDGPDKIIAVPIRKDSLQLGELGTIHLKNNLALCASLIRNALLNYLVGLGRSVLSYEPLKFLARNNLLADCVLDGLCPDWLSVRPLYEITVRPIYFFGRDPFVAAILDIGTTRIIDRNAADLVKDGFPIEGLYVGTREYRTDDRIAPRFRLVGRVKSVDGPELRLIDSRDRIETINAKDVWLEKAAFNSCLSYVFGEKLDQVKVALDRQRFSFRNGPNKLERIKKTIEFLASGNHELAPGISFRFQPLIQNVGNEFFPQFDFASKPVYVFDPTGAKTHAWNDGGLNEFGPYSAQVFTPTQPRVCVICQQSRKGQVEQFLHKFLNGIKLAPPVSHGGSKYKKDGYFEKGFTRKYALKNVLTEFYTAENASPDAYRKACHQAIEKHSNGQKWDLALVQIDECFHDLRPEDNPYFLTKVSFLTHQIPVQEFEIETAQKPDRELSYALNNMALATYAKLNGIPWLLKASPTIAHELVVGLGSAQVGEGRLGEHERFVGITTVFSGDGNYHISNASKAVAFDDYKNALIESLRHTIDKVRQDLNWQPKDHIRLVFHTSFKKFNREEADSVKSLLKELVNFDIEYSFLHIIEQHPHLLFDEKQGGVMDYETRRTKGTYAPQRGGFLTLSNRDVLLTLTGPREVKRPDDGIPHPVLLSLHRDSTFTDMTYLTRQVFAFACHSWRTFLPASLPVTIQYSDLIARALGNLSRVERWNPEVMLGRIGRSRWFL